MSPLGCPEPNPAVGTLGMNVRAPAKFIYAGSVAVHKGVHYLLKAWRELKPTSGIELHLYGSISLPETIIH